MSDIPMTLPSRNRFASIVLQLAVLTLMVDSGIWQPMARCEEPTLLKHHTRRISSIAFSSDGKMLVSGSADDTAVLWDLEKKEHRATLKLPTTCNGVAFSPDCKSVATATTTEIPVPLPILSTCTATVKIWKCANGDELETLTTGEMLTNPALSVSFSPDGKILAVGSHAPSPDRDKGNIVLWDFEKKLPLSTHVTQAGPVYSLSFSPDGTLLAAAGGEVSKGELVLLDVKAGKAKRKVLN